ncbi:hypothetical protein CAP35_11335 [Chitinophagaceae bacterium IBVUCB1]|nr:hypothetical protein CAP35_11335 [Chitinophagaceae bacterium IBVUCB1]
MKDTVIRASYVLSVVLLIIGILFKIQHWPYGVPIWIVGGVAGVVFSTLSIAEVLNSSNKVSYKILWTMAFVVPMSILSTLLYLIVSVLYIQHRRKRRSNLVK